ncbi:MAG: hypothetical protein FWE62_05645 [Firmicutes bacterium]|nr:hypothetical protein [Bacillota bacterium]
MKRKSVRAIAAGLVCLMASACLAACGSFGGGSAKKFYSLFSDPVVKGNLITSAEEIDLGENSFVSNSGFIGDDLVRFKKSFYPDGVGILSVYDLSAKKELTQLADKDNEEIYYRNGFIIIERAFDDVTKTAICDRSGNILFPFSEADYDSYNILIDGKAIQIGKDVYAINGTTAKKIIENIHSNADVYPIGEKMLEVYYESDDVDTSVYYSLDGKRLYSHVWHREEQFYILSENKGLLVTTHLMPIDAKDYTYSMETYKIKLVYELVNFKNGKKTTVRNFNYMIGGGLIPLFELNTKNNRFVTAAGEKCAVMLGYKVKNKLLEKASVAVCFNENLKVIYEERDINDIEGWCKLDGKTALINVGGTSKLVSAKNGKTVKEFGLGEAYVMPEPALILFNDRYYDYAGNQVIDAADYEIGTFYGKNGAGVARAARLSDDKSGYIDSAGSFTAKESGAINNRGAFLTIANSETGKNDVYSLKEMLLYGYASDQTVGNYREGVSTINSVYAVLTTAAKANKVLALRV